MNDPVLNRKLFRHQAQIIHKQVPKLQQGGAPWYTTASGVKGAWQAGPGRHLWDFNKGRMYNTAMLANPWKKARIAGSVATMAGKKIFQKTGVPWAAKKAWPYTGIPKTVRGAKQLVRKSPTAAKIAGGAKVLGGGYLAYEGLTEGAKELKKGNVGTAALFAGSGLWGGGIGTRGYRLFKRGQAAKGGKEGIAAFKKATKTAAGYEKSGFLGKHTGKLMIGGAIGGYALGEGEAEAYEEILSQLSNEQRDEVWEVIKTVAKDVKNVTDKERNKAIEIWIDQQQEKADATKPENLGDTGEGEGATKLEAESTVPDSGSPVNTTEAGILEGQKEQNAKAEAEALKTKFNSADMATQREFLKFRQSISNLTGTYGNDRDLILMKMASGMMTGKTASKGLKGFMDVTGQAMGPTVDTALALSNAQKGRDTDLATAFLKMKGEEAKAAEGGGIKLKGELKTFIVSDPANPDTGYKGSLYGVKSVQGQFDENTGLIYEMGTNQSYSLLGGTDIKEAKGSAAQLQKSRSKLSSMGIGLDYVNHILYDMPDDLKGVTGLMKLVASDWIDESSTWSGMQNKYTQGADSIADYVSDTILDPSNFLDKNGKPAMTKDAEGKDITEYDWAIQNLQNEENEIRKELQKGTGFWGLRVTTEELDELTKAALIENRLKYIIANANKSEDRLTRWDIENAEKSTAILSFFSFKKRFSAAGVNSQMRALQGELQGNFDKEARNYQQLGGTNNYLLNFNSVKKIRDWNVASGMEVAEAQLPDILDSIPIPGVGG